MLLLLIIINDALVGCIKSHQQQQTCIPLQFESELVIDDDNFCYLFDHKK